MRLLDLLAVCVANDMFHVQACTAVYTVSNNFVCYGRGGGCRGVGGGG